MLTVPGMKLCPVCKGSGSRVIEWRPLKWKRCTSCAGRGVKARIGGTGPVMVGPGTRRATGLAAIAMGLGHAS